MKIMHKTTRFFLHMSWSLYNSKCYKCIKIHTIKLRFYELTEVRHKYIISPTSDNSSLFKERDLTRSSFFDETDQS